MKQKDKKNNLGKKNETLSQYDVDPRRIYSANRAMICIGAKKVRIVFFNNPQSNESGISEARKCPIEIQMSKSSWLKVINELSFKTVDSLMNDQCEGTKDSSEEKQPEIMFM